VSITIFGVEFNSMLKVLNGPLVLLQVVVSKTSTVVGSGIFGVKLNSAGKILDSVAIGLLGLGFTAWLPGKEITKAVIRP
jgi:hypothetical protein